MFVLKIALNWNVKELDALCHIEQIADICVIVCVIELSDCVAGGYKENLHAPYFMWRIYKSTSCFW